MREALREVAGLGTGPSAASRLWASPSWPPGGPPYVNAVMRVGWARSPEALLAALHAVEARFGRERQGRWGARTLDLDLLALGGLVWPDEATQALWRGLDPERQGREAPEGLVLPHPRMQDRAFVLLPLLEVEPGWRHPLLGLDAAEMARALPPGAVDGVLPLSGGPLANGAGAA